MEIADFNSILEFNRSLSGRTVYKVSLAWPAYRSTFSQPDGGPLQGQHVGTIRTRTFVGSHPEVPASLHLTAEISVDMMHPCAVLSSPCKPPPCATGEVADGLHRSATASVGDDISVDLESTT